jgi:DNA-binding response OmpR family regulator
MTNILLIDDNVAFRSLVREPLERAGYRVREAAEGGEALRLHEEEPADVVVCDLFMPGKEGLETIRELRRTSRVPIIAITGGGGVATGVNLLDVARVLGANRTLSKPFDIPTLLAAIAEVLTGGEDSAPAAPPS